MTSCGHGSIELREEQQESMHCAGWACLDCEHEAIGECHHQTWCRRDFCGADPILAEAREPALVGV